MTSSHRLRLAKLRARLDQATPSGLSGVEVIGALSVLLTFWPDKGFTPEQRALLERAASAELAFSTMAASALRGEPPWQTNP